METVDEVAVEEEGIAGGDEGGESVEDEDEGEEFDEDDEDEAAVVGTAREAVGGWLLLEEACFSINHLAASFI